MDLFEYMRAETSKKESPLAARLRPRTLEEVVGQEHILGEGKLLSRAIKADKLGSVIFYGPPGTGKTTLAQVIAHTTSSEFTQLNATVAGKKDMEEVINKAKETLSPIPLPRGEIFSSKRNYLPTLLLQLCHLLS